MMTPVRFVTALVLTFSVTAAFAGERTDRALRKLENVVNNSVSVDQRALIQSKLADVRASIESLELSMRKLENVTNNSLPSNTRGQVGDKIADLKEALSADLGSGDRSERPEPPVRRDNGMYCVSACKNVSGQPDMSYTAGARGEIRLVALENANTALKNKYSCNFGQVEVGCESSSWNPKEVTCQVACKNVSGLADMSYTALGQGGSALEAEVNAKEALKDKYSCNFGSVRVTCERR